MNNLEEIKKCIEEAGFSYFKEIDVKTVELLSEVRDMCKNGNCGMYGKNWACPPGCGSLEEGREKLYSYKKGFLVQTVGEIEDSMDWEGIMEAEAIHKKRFLETAEKLRQICPDLFPLGAGACTLCKECSYPDAPCRNPDKKISSMEAYGILVSDICTKNQMKYYYGPDTIAYTSCYFFDCSA